MAGWPILANGSALDCAEIIRTFRSIGFCLDVDTLAESSVGNCRDKLRCLFDQILSVFLKEVVDRECIRPSPAMLGDGQAVDLFKLFWDVRERGGYHSVSKNNMWAFVLKECGLDLAVLASVKLIYFKYLYQLDQWLGRNCRDRSLGNGHCKYGRSLGMLRFGLERQFRGLLTDGQGYKMKNDGHIHLESNKNGKSIDLDIGKSKLHMLTIGNICKMHGSDEETPNDDDKRICGDDDVIVNICKMHGSDEKTPNNDDKKICGDDDVVILKPAVAKKTFYSRKRKRGSLSGMLNWIIQIAKHPDDTAIGLLEDPMYKDQGSKEFWAQSLLAREALLMRRHVDLNAEQSLLQKKLKMHPSMYEDSIILNHQSSERLRCSRRLPSLMKSHLCSCCKPSSATESTLASPRKAKLENSSKEQAPVTVALLATNTTAGQLEDDPLHKQVSVGHLFQAEVPVWTGEVSESDSKWLGTQLWPLETGRHKSQNEMDPIGKGRQESCDCQLPGSVNCVRFHIAERRMKLKLELGVVFFLWRFDRMGEEVSLSWTVEEEKRFKSMVTLNPPSLNKCFWDDAFKCFPMKTRDNLVSYYFNVFLVHRRSYQNRVTPQNIDSDDDESEFGSFSDGFGLEAVKVPGSKILICAQNKQCTDLG